MGDPAQSRGTPGMMCRWLELMKRKSKWRIYLKMGLGLQAVRILWSLLTAMGFSITASNGALAWDLPPHHIQLFRHGLFSASVIHPKTAFTFDVLDNFYMDAMECKTAGMSFFQKLRRFTNNAAPASVPVGFHHHDSGHLTDAIISELLQRASTCVPAVAEPPGFEKVWIWPWTELRP